jgi:hypothetical protein
MKDSRRICILGVFSVIWICKPIPYETVSYINKSEETVLKVLAVGRAGGQGSDSNNFVGNVLGLKKRKKIDPTFHSRLVQQFADWNERMDYQQKQEKFYESAIRKRREIPDFLTKEELDAIDYFQGTGFYLKYQDPKTNIFDTRKSFLLKMHDIVLRKNFLNSFNRSNN